ncbi:MAG: DUF2321 domain-containing protein [Anaerolineaceae bacterium]|nr:DUF2321 domain-containing protein [Anaerolineaceae bacterium]
MEDLNLELNGDVVQCPKCHNQIGREYYIDGVAFLDCGGVIIRKMDASCKQCGRDVFWVTPDIKLQRLIKRVLEGRGKYGK